MGLKLSLSEKDGSAEEQANKQGYSFGKHAETVQDIINAFNTLNYYKLLSLSEGIVVTGRLMDKLDAFIEKQEG